jgi:hypothetical protein
MNQADELHLMAASGTTERVHFPDLFDELTPGLGRDPPWPMVGHILHGRLGLHGRSPGLITRPEEPGLDPFSPASAGVPAIVPDHLKMFVGYMLSDGGYKFRKSGWSEWDQGF